MKYIEKSGINDPSNHENICWVAANGSFALKEDDAYVTLYGYKDVTSFLSGAQPADNKKVHVALSSLQTFEAVWSELALRLISEGTFEGGTIKDTEETI